MSKRIALYWHNGRGLGHTVRNATLGQAILDSMPGSAVLGITGAAKGLELLPPEMDFVKIPSYLAFDGVEGVHTTPILSITKEAYQRQPYDSVLKSLMEDHAAEMLPEILPESRLISEQNTELARTNLRPDLVYLIEYKGKQRILNLELQTSEDPDMTYRMLLYFVELFGKYRLPVISIVLYSFEASIPEPVFREGNESDTLLCYQARFLLSEVIHPLSAPLRVNGHDRHLSPT